MNFKQYRISSLFLVLLCGSVLSCSKMDDTYKDFIKDGEIIYPAKVEAVQTFTGNTRIDLSMLLTSDPKITKVKVFWNNGKDSVEKAIQRSTGVDTVRFSLNNIAEGTYTFDIYAYDKEGHRSIKTDIIGNVFGERFINSLYNRTLKSVSLKNGIAKLEWVGATEQMIGQEIKYTNSQGVAISFIEPRYDNAGKSIDSTFLSSFKKGDSFEFRTLFKPEVNSLDTFYSNYESRVVQ